MKDTMKNDYDSWDEGYIPHGTPLDKVEEVEDRDIEWHKKWLLKILAGIEKLR